MPRHFESCLSCPNSVNVPTMPPSGRRANGPRIPFTRNCGIAASQSSHIPRADLWEAVGGSDGVTALITDLYRRIEEDELLSVAFPHFNSGDATPFFMQWFGGGLRYADDLEGGLLRRHQHRYVSPKAAAAWLRCMREALDAHGLDAEPIMQPLARIAKAMIHSPETESEELRKSCDAVQDMAQVQFETLLNDAAKGRTENVREALEKDRTLANRRGMDNRTLAWVATYRNRPEILELTLKAGGDCNTPACDPMRATMACDVVHMGTGVAVTPLAIARKWHPALVAPLVEHGAIDDVFTAAWLGDLPPCAAISIAIRRSSMPSIPPTTSRKSRCCVTRSAAAASTPRSCSSNAAPR